MIAGLPCCGLLISLNGKRLQYFDQFLMRKPSPPQPLKPCRVGGGVPDGVLDVPVSEVILNEPRIRALIGEGEAASVAQHVRVDLEAERT